MRDKPDALALAQALIRCPSVTPAEGGAMGVLESALKPLGFACHRLAFEAGDSPRVENLYAVRGQGGRNFCFAGHSDVVPVGDRSGWSRDPFGGEIHNGFLYGRGAADMKGAIAAFVAAVARFAETKAASAPGRISLLITGDEEGPAINGTKPMLEWLAARGETIDACLVGEPTNPTAIGEMIKIGRRGSLTGRLTVTGIQGHSAYPQLADNPVHRLIKILNSYTAAPLDTGSAHFQPSSLQVVSVDVGNPASNVIPAEARALFNIRFNDRHSGAALSQWLHERARAQIDARASYKLEIQVSGESFLTTPGPWSEMVAASVEKVSGRKPELSTTGGTSDARFIKDYCPVVEFGATGQTMHQIDERIALADLAQLTDIYADLLQRFFAAS